MVACVVEINVDFFSESVVLSLCVYAHLYVYAFILFLKKCYRIPTSNRITIALHLQYTVGSSSERDNWSIPNHSMTKWKNLNLSSFVSKVHACITTSHCFFLTSQELRHKSACRRV